MRLLRSFYAFFNVIPRIRPRQQITSTIRVIARSCARFRFPLRPECGTMRRRVRAALVNLAIDYATQKGYRYIFCNAQKQTIAFYERCGFETISEEFIEAGIPHVKMRKELV